MDTDNFDQFDASYSNIAPFFCELYFLLKHIQTQSRLISKLSGTKEVFSISSVECSLNFIFS